MNTGKESRSKEEEVTSDSEDEVFAFCVQAMRRVHTRKVSKDYICYLCKKRGHLARNCPTKEEEEVAAELAKPRAPMAAWCEVISDDEGRIDAVPNTLYVTGQSSSEKEEEVSKKHSLAKLKSLDPKKYVTASMTLWNERKISIIEPGKGETMSNNGGNNSGEIRINQINKFMSKDKGYYGAQNSGHKYYHPEYGIPVSEYCPMH